MTEIALDVVGHKPAVATEWTPLIAGNQLLLVQEIIGSANCSKSFKGPTVQLPPTVEFDATQIADAQKQAERAEKRKIAAGLACQACCVGSCSCLMATGVGAASFWCGHTSPGLQNCAYSISCASLFIGAASLFGCIRGLTNCCLSDEQIDSFNQSEVSQSTTRVIEMWGGLFEGQIKQCGSMCRS